MATNYTKIYNDLTLTECELYEYLNTNKGFCCEKGWKWENDVTGAVKTGREWKKYWQTNPPDCSGCTSPFIIVRPFIIGDPLVGGSLSVDNGTWGGTLPITYSYQWYANGTPILGATNDNLDLVSNYIGQIIKCEVTALNICDSASSDSNSVTVVSPPQSLTAPSVNAVPLTGSTITRVAGTYSGTPIITLTYEWLDASNNVLGTGASYNVSQSDFGKSIKLKETATNAYGSTTQSTSLVAVVSAPVMVSANVISGNDYVGQVLTTTNGSWSGTATITYSYQWYRDSTPIGTNSNTYTQVLADADYDITCQVTATNSYGSSASTSNSIYTFTSQYKDVLNEDVAQGYALPTVAQQKKENKIMLGIVNNGAFAALSKFGSIATDGSIGHRSINWINPTGTKFVFNGTGTMVDFRGYKLNGTDSWINTKENLSTSTKYLQSNCSVTVWTDGDFLTNGLWGGTLWGGSDGTNQILFYNSVGFTGKWLGRIAGTVDRDTNNVKKAEHHYSMEYNGTNVITRVGSDVYTFAQASGGTRPNYELGIGCRNKATPDQFITGTISYFAVGNSTAPALVKSVLDSVTPSIFPSVTPATLYGDYDFNDLSKMWQDAAKTIQATTSSPVRVISPQAGSAQGDLVALSDAERATSSTWVLNGKNVLYFNGSNSYDLPLQITGDSTLFFVSKNDDSVNGSHLIYGQNYVPITGSGYSGNASQGGEYFIPHTQSVAVGGIRVTNQSNAYNVMSFKIVGQEWTSVNSIIQSKKVSTSSPYYWSKIGKGFLANWDFDGKHARIIIYSGILTDKQQQDIILSLKTQYGIL